MIDYILKRMSDIPSCDLEDLIDIKKFSMKDVIQMDFATEIGTSVFEGTVLYLSCLYGYLVGNGLFHRKGSHPVDFQSNLLYIENDQNEVIFSVYSPDDKHIQELFEFLEDKSIVGIIIMKRNVSPSVVNDFKRIMLELGIFKEKTYVYTFNNISYYLSTYTEINSIMYNVKMLHLWYYFSFNDSERVHYLYQEFVKACLSRNENIFEHCRSLISDLLNSMGNYFDVSRTEDFKQYHHFFMKMCNNDYMKSKKIIHKMFRIAYKSSLNQPSLFRSTRLNTTLMYVLTEYIQ